MPVLYHFHDCPYCFKVRLYCHERGVEFTSALCERGALPPELPSLAPLGQLPVWVTDEGKPVFGSRTIIDFLNHLDPGDLLPADPIARARCWMADDVADEGLLQPLLELDRMTRGKEPGQWDLKRWKVLMGRSRRTLDILEALLGGREWLIGGKLSYADIAVALPISVVERYGLDLSAHPGLASLSERIERRPATLAARKAPSTQGASSG
jgi:glutathione S-transferase